MLAGMLAFAAVVAPEHLAVHPSHDSHDDCPICHVIHNTPSPEPGAAADVRPLLSVERGCVLAVPAPLLAPHVRIRPSRAPPLSC